MPDETDNLEKLLSDVRKTIYDNRLFIEKLVDETLEEESSGDLEVEVIEEFEEL